MRKQSIREDEDQVLLVELVSSLSKEGEHKLDSIPRRQEERLVLPLHYTSLSRVIHSTAEDAVRDQHNTGGDDTDDDEEEQRSPSVTVPLRFPHTTLQQVCQWLLHHRGEEPEPIAQPLRSTLMSDLVHPWDAEFIDNQVMQEDGGDEYGDPVGLYDLTLAAFYLDIPGLLDLCAAKIASMIKGEPMGLLPAILAPSKTRRRFTKAQQT